MSLITEISSPHIEARSREKNSERSDVHVNSTAETKLFAASDVTGYGAVGVAAHGNNALVAAALGKKSAAEAQTIVLQKLVKAGGTNAKIITTWRDHTSARTELLPSVPALWTDWK